MRANLDPIHTDAAVGRAAGLPGIILHGTATLALAVFRVGAQDGAGTIGWVDVDDVGGLPRPFDRSAYDTKTKTMLTTFRFPGRCFGAASRRLQLKEIRAIPLHLNRGDKRPIAFDDVEIVKS